MADDQVFEVGERTVMRMQSQPFLTDEVGTIATDPGRTPVAVQVASDGADTGMSDIERLERKIDTLTSIVQTLARRLDSIDAVVARAVARS